MEAWGSKGLYYKEGFFIVFQVRSSLIDGV